MENNILLDGNPQFILLVVVVTTILTLVLLTNRLVDRLHHDKVKNDRKALDNTKIHIIHLSRITVLQLGVAGLILVRILFSTWYKALWFDVGIIAIFLFLSGYWTLIHTIYFGDWYSFKKWYCFRRQAMVNRVLPELQERHNR